MPSLLDYLSESDNGHNGNDKIELVKKKTEQRVMSERKYKFIPNDMNTTDDAHTEIRKFELSKPNNPLSEPQNDQQYDNSEYEISKFEDQMIDIEQLTSQTTALLQQSEIELQEMKTQLDFTREECNQLIASSYIKEYEHDSVTQQLQQQIIDLQYSLEHTRILLETKLEAKSKLCMTLESQLIYEKSRVQQIQHKTEKMIHQFTYDQYQLLPPITAAISTINTSEIQGNKDLNHSTVEDITEKDNSMVDNSEKTAVLNEPVVNNHMNRVTVNHISDVITTIATTAIGDNSSSNNNSTNDNDNMKNDNDNNDTIEMSYQPSLLKGIVQNNDIHVHVPISARSVNHNQDINTSISNTVLNDTSNTFEIQAILPIPSDTKLLQDDNNTNSYIATTAMEPYSDRIMKQRLNDLYEVQQKLLIRLSQLEQIQQQAASSGSSGSSTTLQNQKQNQMSYLSIPNNKSLKEEISTMMMMMSSSSNISPPAVLTVHTDEDAVIPSSKTIDNSTIHSINCSQVENIMDGESNNALPQIGDTVKTSRNTDIPVVGGISQMSLSTLPLASIVVDDSQTYSAETFQPISTSSSLLIPVDTHISLNDTPNTNNGSTNSLSENNQGTNTSNKQQNITSMLNNVPSNNNDDDSITDEIVYSNNNDSGSSNNDNDDEEECKEMKSCQACILNTTHDNDDDGNSSSKKDTTINTRQQSIWTPVTASLMSTSHKTEPTSVSSYTMNTTCIKKIKKNTLKSTPITKPIDTNITKKIKKKLQRYILKKREIIDSSTKDDENSINTSNVMFMPTFHVVKPTISTLTADSTCTSTLRNTNESYETEKATHDDNTYTQDTRNTIEENHPEWKHVTDNLYYNIIENTLNHKESQVHQQLHYYTISQPAVNIDDENDDIHVHMKSLTLNSSHYQHQHQYSSPMSSSTAAAGHRMETTTENTRRRNSSPIQSYMSTNHSPILNKTEQNILRRSVSSPTRTHETAAAATSAEVEYKPTPPPQKTKPSSMSFRSRRGLETHVKEDTITNTIITTSSRDIQVDHRNDTSQSINDNDNNNNIKYLDDSSLLSEELHHHIQQLPVHVHVHIDDKQDEGDIIEGNEHHIMGVTFNTTVDKRDNYDYGNTDDTFDLFLSSNYGDTRNFRPRKSMNNSSKIGTKNTIDITKLHSKLDISNLRHQYNISNPRRIPLSGPPNSLHYQHKFTSYKNRKLQTLEMMNIPGKLPSQFRSTRVLDHHTTTNIA